MVGKSSYCIHLPNLSHFVHGSVCPGNLHDDEMKILIFWNFICVVASERY